MAFHINLMNPVSSRLDYLNQNPKASLPKGEVDHELKHLKVREQVSGATSIGAVVLLVLAVAGLIGGGHIIVGALAAIGLFGGVYSYFCRQAGASLSAKQAEWLTKTSV